MSTTVPLRLLLVEDSTSDAELIVLELQRGGFAPETTIVDKAAAFRTALTQKAWDAIIADYNLPAFTGLEALEIHRAHGQDVPFFLVSGTIGEELAVQAMRSGAHDYFLKDNLARLSPAVTRELRDAQGRHERQLDLERLRASERRFNAIFQNSPVAIIVTAFEDGTIVDTNPAALELFGYSREELIGRRCSHFGLWEDLEDRRMIIGHALAQGRTYTIEREIHTGSGSTVVVLAGFSYMDVDGNNRIVVTLQDITGRKLAEGTLRENEERFRLLIENSSDLIIEVALDGTVLYASPNHVALTGRTAAEMTGTSAFANIHPDDVAQVQARFRDRAPSGLFRNRSADGSWHWLESAGRVFRLSTGEDRGVVVSRDVTERVEAEKLRLRLEEQLRQAQKLEALGTLAGGIAHDFNNILTAMMAYTDMSIMEPGVPTAARQYLAEVRSACDRAKDLVRQILAFSRQQKPERISLRLGKVIQEVIKLLRSTLPSTIEIESHLAPDVPLVLADPSQIHQVLMNLGANAAHAMRHRPGRLSIRLEAVRPDKALLRAVPELRPGRHACITVSDTGAGMTPETLTRLFEPFFTTKVPGEGTGLGLAVVHGIVRDHEGAIRVESTPDTGSTFWIYLPEHITTVPEATVPGAAIPAGRGERVLFIDDEPAICKVASRILERLGYQVTAFLDPTEALEAFAARPLEVDLVVTDLTMPRLTGIDVARRILELRPGLPVLLTSGFSATWSNDSVRTLGIRELLPKPLSVQRLAEAVRHALDGAAFTPSAPE